MSKTKPYRLRNFSTKQSESTILNFKNFKMENPICNVHTIEKIPLIENFVKYCCRNLNFDEAVKICLTEEKIEKSFAIYYPIENTLKVNIKNRHVVDVLRSIAHELKHHEQNMNGRLGIGTGRDGSLHENEANSFAGVMLRKFGKLHPEIYDI